MSPANKRPVQLEDLLRLKRAERPPAEFWNEFDRALRAKQLAALVGRRPWWQSLPRVLAGWRRAGIPIGATAAAAIAFFGLHHHHGAAPGETTNAMIANAPTTAVAPATPVAVSAPVASRIEPANSSASLPVAAVSFAQISAAATSGATPHQSAALNSLVAETTEPISNATNLSAELSVAPTLSVASVSEHVSPHPLIVAPKSFEVTRVAANRAPVDPLQQMAPPSERTRTSAKMLAALIATNSSPVTSRSLERTANRLSEEQLYDQVHRFGAYGDSRGIGGSMKF